MSDVMDCECGQVIRYNEACGKWLHISTGDEACAGPREVEQFEQNLKSGKYDQMGPDISNDLRGPYNY